MTGKDYAAEKSSHRATQAYNIMRDTANLKADQLDRVAMVLENLALGEVTGFEIEARAASRRSHPRIDNHCFQLIENIGIRLKAAEESPTVWSHGYPKPGIVEELEARIVKAEEKLKEAQAIPKTQALDVLCNVAEALEDAAIGKAETADHSKDRAARRARMFPHQLGEHCRDLIGVIVKKKAQAELELDQTKERLACWKVKHQSLAGILTEAEAKNKTVDQLFAEAEDFRTKAVAEQAELTRKLNDAAFALRSSLIGLNMARAGISTGNHDINEVRNSTEPMEDTIRKLGNEIAMAHSDLNIYRNHAKEYNEAMARLQGIARRLNYLMENGGATLPGIDGSPENQSAKDLEKYIDGMITIMAGRIRGGNADNAMLEKVNREANEEIHRLQGLLCGNMTDAQPPGKDYMTPEKMHEIMTHDDYSGELEGGVEISIKNLSVHQVKAFIREFIAATK